MPRSNGPRFLVILKNKLVETWLWAGPVQLGESTVDDVGTVSIVKIVSLSPRVEKTKSQEVNKRFVPEQLESSVFRISLHLYFTYILHISILVLCYIATNILDGDIVLGELELQSRYNIHF